ncbi:MAG: tyrosine-protein phosphatase [Psychroserpens sp.]|nr:tyrosine-protein phosphatase [Psychroserpens sp.]
MRVLLTCISICCFGWMTFAQTSEATKMELQGLKNLYQLNDSIFRSEQPNNKAFKALESKGVKTILNLRRLKDDNHKARNTDLVLEHLRLKSKEITETDIIEALRIIKNAEKPILIHCWHGSDRTGIVSAAYRIIFEDWSKQDAIAEFRRPEFGYHENWYPNLLDLLNTLDIAKIKKELGI